MPKSLLQQALEQNDIPTGTIQGKYTKGWYRLTRPRFTKCPFGKIHKSNRNARIRNYDYGYQIRCFGKSCAGKSIERDTNGGMTEEESAALYKNKVPEKVYSADMF